MRCLAALTLACFAAAAFAQDDTAYREAVDAFLPSLSDVQKDAVTFPFDDADRENWHYAGVRKIGLPLAQLDDEQRQTFLTLIRRVLSDEGYSKAETIRLLEDILRQVENNNTKRDWNEYYLAVYGEPSATGPWGLRYEGHHVALHWTFLDGKIISTSPQFFGANPAQVPAGFPLANYRVLAEEEDLGFKMLSTLTEQQHAVAVVDGVAPAEVITGAERVAVIEGNLGLKYKDMTDEQKQIVTAIVTKFLSPQRPEAQKERLGRIHAGPINDVTFCWMGAEKMGEGHYYRIQGQEFVAEIDNTQGNANHIHTVWRDFDRDFGRDVLAEHYKSASADHGHGAK